jgi:hypothetical protein
VEDLDFYWRGNIVGPSRSLIRDYRLGGEGEVDKIAGEIGDKIDYVVGCFGFNFRTVSYHVCRVSHCNIPLIPDIW